MRKITEENFKEVLRSLSFEENGEIFTRNIQGNLLKADFSTRSLTYPTGITIGNSSVNSFKNEYFVQFECVHRLLTKGYNVNHIVLEVRWPVGHGASGGIADILVTNNDEPFLIIECKTEGNEFKKAWENTISDGGQLFTYAQQEKSTKYVCLYTSYIDGTNVSYTSNIISLKDNELLKRYNEKRMLFENATSVETLYKAWNVTYECEYTTKGIFEEDIQAYNIGEINYKIDGLKDIKYGDVQSKYNEFANILRKYNVSGRENAFDKLINLFLCKIVDERNNKNDLKFNWRGSAIDSVFNLQDRLQKLYKEGMNDFLREEVTYIEDSAIDTAFRFVRKDPDSTKETIKEYFKKLKYFTNNDFAFIDVHNEKLFHQNSEILKEIVKMLQDIRLYSTNQNQFLGDLFEGFLDNGVKQSEGQYFTPLPIVKFIINSLPLNEIIQQKGDCPPKVIDYACGAGHFLNEIALQIQERLSTEKHIDIQQYFKAIVGIEKEYRLSKVAKVSAFMHGQNDIQIIYADGLSEKSQTASKEYSILVSNPPYAVKGFLDTLTVNEKSKFQLYKEVESSTQSNNNSIETFFVEKSIDLLEADGVACIILPASILTKNDTLYISTREMLIKNFKIVSIVSFGKATFAKTPTATIALFLKKKEENPKECQHYRTRIEYWFNGCIDDVYSDCDYIERYCEYMGYNYEYYKSFLNGAIGEMVDNYDVFENYKTECEKIYPAQSDKLIEFCKRIEKEKVYYFTLSLNSKVVIIKSPHQTESQKLFLGYKWSDAKGNEGIKYINSNGRSTFNILEINTPLYNPNKSDSEIKLCDYIRNNFLGDNEIEITQEMKPYIRYTFLNDMMDFTSVDFKKELSLDAKEEFFIDSKYQLKKLGTLIRNVEGPTTKTADSDIQENGNIPVVTQEKDNFFAGYCTGLEPITDLPIIVFGDHTCAVKLVKEEFVRGADGTVLIKPKEEFFDVELFYYLLKIIPIPNPHGYERHNKYLKKIKIPLIPVDVQTTILKEIKELESTFTFDKNTHKSYDNFKNIKEEKIKEVIMKYINNECPPPNSTTDN